MMKTKILVILTLFVFLTGCVKEYINNHSNNDDEVTFTATNYAYEPQLYEQYLQNELQVTSAKLDSVNAIINNNQGSDIDFAERDNLNEQLNYLSDEQKGALSTIEDLVLDKPIPCPDETVGFILCYPDLDKLVIPNSNGLRSLIIFDEDDNEVHTIDDGEFNEVPGLENFASYQNLALEENTGQLTFVVVREDLNGEEIEYSTTVLK